MSNAVLHEEIHLRTDAAFTRQNRSEMNLNQKSVALLRTSHLDLHALPSGIPFPIRTIESWEDAKDFFCDDRTGCLLIDFDSNREQTISQLARLHDEWILLPIIACSISDRGCTAIEAARAGCVEFVPIPLDCETLMGAIRRACAFDTLGSEPPYLFRKRLTSLTSREQEVLRLFLDGMNTKTIAKQLDVSYQTIDKHRNRALKKMHCGSLVDLCRGLYQKQTRAV